MNPYTLSLKCMSFLEEIMSDNGQNIKKWIEHLRIKLRYCELFLVSNIKIGKTSGNFASLFVSSNNRESSFDSKNADFSGQ